MSRSLSRFLCALSICALPLAAQTAPLFPTAGYFRQHFQTPNTRVTLDGPSRLDDFLVSGRLELSLRSYLELVMANNTDIAIERVSLETYRNNVLRQYGIFDPFFSSSFSAVRAKDPSATALTGESLVNSLNQNAQFNYSQMLSTGTSFTVGFTGSKYSTNDAFATFNPSLTASLSAGFTQPLLRNRGSFITRLPILVATSQARKSEFDFRDRVLQLVQQAESAYWDVIESRERLRVQEEYLKLSDAALKRAQRELELGATSPLDIYRPQQQYATAEIAVSQQRYDLAQREDALRRLMGADLDPKFRKVAIVLTENVMPPAETSPVEVEAAVDKALALRPDLKSVRQSLDVDELSIKSATNALRPDLSLTGGYTSQGLGGMYYQRDNVFGGGNVIGVVPGGFGDALNQLFRFNVPVYQMGITLNFPIRDRRASADLANSLVQKRLDVLRERNTAQRIRLDVVTAVHNLESAKAGVKLAAVAADFAKKQVEAEQKKYDLGTNVMYFVLVAQTDLVNAQSELVSQSIQYRKSLLSLYRYTGELLDERGIVVK
ncbi:MAG TPA: TolC family protein [Bryobacteraceae bacterium]|nr:TolC family protein [Bryobacteraceae bacterium]